MPFAVQWTGHLGPATTHRDTAVEAIRFAIEMLGKGYADVVIVDSADGGRGICADPICAVLQERETIRPRPRIADVCEPSHHRFVLDDAAPRHAVYRNRLRNYSGTV
jgi:hypothetical protein